jgi:plastocyanin
MPQEPVMSPHHLRIPIRLLTAVTLSGVVAAASANSVHEVMQDGLTFQPDELTVEPGDTVRWIWTGGSHTVTSGPDCTFDGVYFDEDLTSSNPVVEWEVPDEIGVVPYFCMPHCSFEMIGEITIEAGDPCPGDIDGCGSVDTNDLLLVLSQWGPCKKACPADVNDSGEVDTEDLLIVLAGWGPCPS